MRAVSNYILLDGGRRFIDHEVKSLGTKLGKEKALKLEFRYSRKKKIRRFAMTNGRTWRV